MKASRDRANGRVPSGEDLRGSDPPIDSCHMYKQANPLLKLELRWLAGHMTDSRLALAHKRGFGG
jgi:hypothetical protein